jgi:hypothetical protein
VLSGYEVEEPGAALVVLSWRSIVGLRLWLCMGRGEVDRPTFGNYREWSRLETVEKYRTMGIRM